MSDVIVCRPMQLPDDLLEVAARAAVEENPSNRPRVEAMRGRGLLPDRRAIAVSTTKYWRAGKVDLSVSFMESRPAALRKKIVEHLNAWSQSANVRFRETTGQGQVRIAFITNDPNWGGYWSYVGTDILQIDLDKPTMNLERFTLQTPESEFRRVVRHEAGHTLGCEHEHVRRAVVDRIDRQKAYDYFWATQRWDKADVDSQVLTPVEEVALIGTPDTDETSIMCYDLPGQIMKNGQPVVGGKDINAIDHTFMGKVYPRATKTSKRKSARKRAKRPKERRKVAKKRGGPG